MILCNVGEVYIFERGLCISALEYARMLSVSSFVLLATINTAHNIVMLGRFSEMYAKFREACVTFKA